MKFNRGHKIHLADGEHEVVGVEGDSVFIERLSDQSIKKYTTMEADTLVRDSLKNGWYVGPWPFTVTDYMRGEEWGLEDDLKEMGLSESERNLFKHPIYELEVKLEIHRNGDVYILAINGQVLPEKIKSS